MDCTKCSEIAEHSITIREGVVPDRTNNPKLKDKSRTRVVGFCGKHWVDLREYLGLKKSHAG